MAECTTTPEGCAVSVTVQLERPELTPEHVEDIGAVWGLFFAAAVGIFCLRRLLALFTVSHHED